MTGSKKHKIDIIASEKLVKDLLISLKSDSLMKKRFNVQISKGVIDGYYNSLIVKLFDSTPSILRVKGKYSITNGKLNLNLLPSNVFYGSLLFPLIMVIFLGRSLFLGEIDWTPFVIFLIVSFAIVLGLVLGFFFERKRFKKKFFELVENARE